MGGEKGGAQDMSSARTQSSHRKKSVTFSESEVSRRLWLCVGLWVVCRVLVCVWGCFLCEWGVRRLGFDEDRAQHMSGARTQSSHKKKKRQFLGIGGE